DGTIGLDDLLADPREDGAAAVPSACRRYHRRLLQGVVDLLHQEPGPAVGHIHLAGGRRNRAFGADRFQQRDFSGPNPFVIGEIETDAEARMRHESTSFRRILLYRVLPGGPFPATLYTNKNNGNAFAGGAGRAARMSQPYVPCAVGERATSLFNLG